jgi:glycosyltransferase involved in cell wall biosynthesis
VTAVHVVLPEDVYDVRRPSGGNTYDRQVCRGLAERGWKVREHVAPGDWPDRTPAAEESLSRLLAGLPNAALVLLDGLVASGVPAVLTTESRRLRLVVLVHLPLGEAEPHPCLAEIRAREAAALSAATAVVVTSEWTRRRLLDLYRLRPHLVHVARPGTDPAETAVGTSAGGELICVAAITRAKGHDDLLAALADVADLRWHCSCIGSLERDPDYARELRASADRSGIGDRVRFLGALGGADLDRAYGAADALVLATRIETYGMVVTESLARGLPVIATAPGGLPEALRGPTPGPEPGMLVPVGDRVGLAAALRRWLTDAELRDCLRRAAAVRRKTLTGWPDTTGRIAAVLEQVAA